MLSMISLCVIAPLQFYTKKISLI